MTLSPTFMAQFVLFQLVIAPTLSVPHNNTIVEPLPPVTGYNKAIDLPVIHAGEEIIIQPEEDII